MISVNIVTHNSQPHIKKCILCLKRQTIKRFSILVIDNASSDRTVHECKRLKIRVVQNRRNIGYAAAHNQGIKLTKSKYILTLNPDMFLKPNFLYYMLQALEKDQSAGSASGLLLRIDPLSDKPKVVDGAGLYMRRNRRQGLRHEGASTKKAFLRGYIFGPDGSAALYRRKMLNDIAIHNEIFDEEFFMHKEDIDLAWRAQRAGWHSLFIPQARALHIRTFRSGQRRSVSPFLQKISLRNRYLLMIKNDEFKYFIRDFGHIVFYEIGILLYVILFERSSFGAYKEVIDLWKSMIKKRAYIQHAWPNNHQAYAYFN